MNWTEFILLTQFAGRQGFNRVTGFGGRGISLLRPSLGARVAFTSNYMEQVFTGLTEQQSAAYNADYLNPTSTPSSRRDATSPTTVRFCVC